MLSNKVKSLLLASEKTNEDLFTALEINKQSLFNKFSRNSFSVADLIKTAELCGYSLVFTNGSNTIALTLDDVSDSKKKKPED